MFLHLTTSIPDDVCLEILLERKFFETLDQSTRMAIHCMQRDAVPGGAMTEVARHDSPPAKKRRLSPQQSSDLDLDSTPEVLPWILLQAACRCVDLLSPSSLGQKTKSKHIGPTWNASPKDQASLLGSLLEMIISVLHDDLDAIEKTVLADLLNVLLSCWKGDSSTGRTQSDDLDRAFASHCLMPGLIVLDRLRATQFGHEPFDLPKNTLGRLVAKHCVFPGRALFNERFVKKWRGMGDLILFEHLEPILKHLRERMFATGAPSHPELCFLVFEIAARSIPASDLRRRQNEQPWIDALFMSLTHLLWPQIPQITSTGVVHQELSTNSALKDNPPWVLPLENLVNVALVQRMHVSLPILGYILSAILAADTQILPWTLVSKILRLDINILIPNSGISTSPDLLKQVLGRVESSNVSREIYSIVRGDILPPLLRGFARSRDMLGFIAIWQQNLADAIRVRYTSKQDTDIIPAILAWEDDDLLEEFQALSRVYAPPSLGQRLLMSLLDPTARLVEKVGSTADVFATLTIFSALLESPFRPGTHLDVDKPLLADLLSAAMKALPRKSDYQAQRWKLWKFVKIVVRLLDEHTLPPGLETLLGPEYNFLSLSKVKKLDGDLARKDASKYLEYLECFSFVIELALKSQDLAQFLQSEVNHLTDILVSDARYDQLLWDGQNFNCIDLTKLVAASIGSLLQRPEIFWAYPEIFKRFIETCLETIYSSRTSQSQLEISPTLLDLYRAVIEVEGIAQSPVLRDRLLEVVAETSDSNSTALKVYKSLSRGLSMESISRSTARKIGASISRRLFQHSTHETYESIADHLDFLIYLESLFPGTLIDCKDWRQWIAFSDSILASGRLRLSQSCLASVHMLGQILRTVYRRALGAPKAPFLSDITSWMSEHLGGSTKRKVDKSAYFCSQTWLCCACLSRNQSNAMPKADHLEQMQQKFMRRFKANLDKALRHDLGVVDLLDLWLTLDASSDLEESRVHEEVKLAALHVQRELQRLSQSFGNEVSTEQGSLVVLSIRHKCLQLTSEPDMMLEPKAVEFELLELASTAGDTDDWTNNDFAEFAIRADLFARQIGPLGLPLALKALREKGNEKGYQVTRPILVNSLLSHVSNQHLIRQPQLGSELTELACIDGSPQRLGKTGMLLALDNCRAVLERHPLLVNQPTLDRLLASLHSAASSTTDDLQSLDDDMKKGPSPVDLYQRLCAVIGAVLARHRKRLSDRYHLLLPVLQSLLRCLFWPGTDSILDDQRRFVTSTADTFSRTLPKWLRESATALPPSSADQLARLLSSICNPTVSAARSSKSRGHNELNDEIKRARQLAGQHMQYLVMEYARCTLDGQISPSVKEQLMPGLYRVMDAMDRDIMRALNAGMDASSRAIFKSLYDDWSRYGKWDKS